jgi:hypothetical protein
MQAMLTFARTVKSDICNSAFRNAYSPAYRNPDIQFFIDGFPLCKPLETELLGVTLSEGVQHSSAEQRDR